MRLTLVISCVGCGGAERMLVRMANHWAGRRHAVTLLTFDDGTVPPFYELDPAIDHRPIDLARHSPTPVHALWNNLTRLPALREAIERSRPEAVVAFMNTCNVRTLLATRESDVPVVVCEQVDPAQHPIGPVWERLRRRLYPQAARIVVLSESSRSFFPPRLQDRVRVIPNAVALPADLPPREEPEARPRILLGMGRLTPQKGFDLLLEALARIEHRLADWEVVVWGEGEERPRLEARAARLGLDRRVRFPGITRTPFTELRRAELFVLSSRFEGFPNVLCEALAAGLPAVSFDCPTGPGEIVRHETDGLLVPDGDVAGLARALERLMADGDERRRLGRRAPEILDRFGVERVMRRWDAVVEEAVGHREPSRP